MTSERRPSTAGRGRSRGPAHRGRRAHCIFEDVGGADDDHHLHWPLPYPPRAFDVAVNVAVRTARKTALLSEYRAYNLECLANLVSRLGFEPRTRGSRGRRSAVHSGTSGRPTQASVPALVHPLPCRVSERHRRGCQLGCQPRTESSTSESDDGLRASKSRSRASSWRSGRTASGTGVTASGYNSTRLVSCDRVSLLERHPGI
jgi:hypothetical protein